MDLLKISKDSKIIITSGCSYSGLFHWLYPGLNKIGVGGIEVINLGEGGRSNKWITQSLIYTLDQLKDHPRENIFVIGLLSSLDRKDVVIDKRSNSIHNELKFEHYTDIKYINDAGSYRQYKWFNHVLDNIHDYDTNRQTGLLSLTNILQDSKSVFAFERIAGLYYQYFHSKLSGFEEMLSNVIHLQSYCKLNSIRYLIMTWQDIFHDTSHAPFWMIGQSFDPTDNSRTHLCKYSKLSKRIDNYPEVRYLYNQVDFDNWWFNNTTRCQTGGLADWCIENGPGLFGSAVDYIHPTQAGYEQFMDSVLLPLVFQKTGWSTAQR